MVLVHTAENDPSKVGLKSKANKARGATTQRHVTEPVGGRCGSQPCPRPKRASIGGAHGWLSSTRRAIGDFGPMKFAVVRCIACRLFFLFGTTSPPLGTCTNNQFRKFQTARSRLYHRRFLRPNTHFSAFFEIYKICNPLHRSDLKKSIKFCHFWRILHENLVVAATTKICS